MDAELCRYRGDNLGVDCEMFREAISARLDGEPEPVAPDLTDEHLAGCVPCCAWKARAEVLSRAMRVRAVPDVPDLTGRILATAAAPVAARSWWPRVALAVVAVAQVALGIAQWLGIDAGVPASMTGHLFHESTAWNLALGFGMLWTALRTRASVGMLPVMTGFLLVLAGFSAYDLVTGAVSVTRIASHGLLVAGLVLLVVVHRQHRRDPSPESSRVGSAPEMSSTEDDAAQPGSQGGKQAGKRPPLRPASHHKAA